MHPVTTALAWCCLAALILSGFLGSMLNAVPGTGLVLGPLIGALLLRHGRAGPKLLLGGLTGRLPIASWLEAHEVVEQARRDVVIIGGAAGVLGAVQVLFLPISQQLSAVGVALVPLLIAAGLRVTLLTPLSRQLLAGHRRWLAGLRQALTPPALLAQLPGQVAPVPDRIRRRAG